jgi:hypothetical protein
MSKNLALKVAHQLTMTPASKQFFVRYGLFMGVSNLAWESAHLPLYTLWAKSEISYLVFVVVHCTAGDLMIAFATLCIALFLVRNVRRPNLRFNWVLGITIGLGIAYTFFSEWLNVSIRQSWAYSDLMPVIPVIGTGISPVAQWIFLPLFGLLFARKNFVNEENVNEP